MNEDQRLNLKFLADGLDRVPPEKFRMDIWGSGRLDPFTPDLQCGFAGCAIGWAPRFIPNCQLMMVIGPIPYYDGKLGMEAVVAYFGMTKSQANALFHASGYLPANLKEEELDAIFATGPIPPSMVAAKIRSFLDSWGNLQSWTGPKSVDVASRHRGCFVIWWGAEQEP